MVETHGPTDDNKVRRKHFSCSITKDTYHILGICNTYYFSTTTLVTRTGLNVTVIRVVEWTLPNMRRTFHSLSEGETEKYLRRILWFEEDCSEMGRDRRNVCRHITLQTFK
jgi:hypothetical protein